MTNSQSFLSQIIANPTDDALRLAYCDWLEEHGEANLAETVRLECELAAMPTLVVIPTDQRVNMDGERLDMTLSTIHEAIINNGQVIEFRILALGRDVVTTIRSAQFGARFDRSLYRNITAAITSSRPTDSRRETVRARLRELAVTVDLLDANLCEKDRGLYTTLGFRSRPTDEIRELVCAMSRLHPITELFFRGDVQKIAFGVRTSLAADWFAVSNRRWDQFEQEAILEAERQRIREELNETTGIRSVFERW